MSEKESVLELLEQHVKNRPKRYVTPKEDATGNETFASYSNRPDIFIDELVGKTQALQQFFESPELLEKLAMLEHLQWGEWIMHMESLKVISDVPIRQMWLKLACLPYEKLTKLGKESDIKFARRVLKVLLGGSQEPRKEKQKP